MTSSVLLVHDSRYGSTQEIADEMAKTMRNQGHEVTIASAKDAPDPRAFDLVVAGSPIYASRIRRAIVSYFNAHRAVLAEKPVALFAVAGSLAEDTVANREAAEAALAPLKEGIKVRSLALFAGVIDPARLPWLARIIVRGVGAKAGDFRDWEAIRAWAESLPE